MADRGRVSLPSPWIQLNRKDKSEVEMMLRNFWGLAAKDLQLLRGHLTCDGCDPFCTIFHQILVPSLFSMLPLNMKWIHPSCLVPILFIRKPDYYLFSQATYQERKYWLCRCSEPVPTIVISFCKWIIFIWFIHWSQSVANMSLILEMMLFSVCWESQVPMFIAVWAQSPSLDVVT